MPNKTFTQLLGFDHPPARFSQALVLIIDMQEEYRSGAVPLANIGTTIAAVAELISMARKYHTPVIHIINQGPDGARLFNREGDYFAQCVEVAAKGDEPVIIKHLPNAFAGTQLKTLVEQTGRKELIIVGCTTHVCLAATVHGALDLGYASTIVASATTSRDLYTHNGEHIPADVVKQTALAQLRDAFAVVVNCALDLLP